MSPWRGTVRTVRRAGARIGRRGSTLLFLALLDLIFAFSLTVPPAEAKRSPTIVFISDVLPLRVWAVGWGLVGVLCLNAAFRRTDRYAFGAAVLIKVMWGTLFLIGWLIGAVERGWTSAVVWLALAVFVYIISGWPEP